MIKEKYRLLDDWLVDNNSEIRASEVQGLLGGLMAVHFQISFKEFIAHLAEYAEVSVEKLAQINDSLELVYSMLCKSWTGIAVDFEMLLPDDDELIDERVDALGAWCGAFLAGLGLSGELSQSLKMSVDARSALTDLSEITRIEVGDGSDDLEKAFFDVSEHVRLSAVLVLTDLCDPQNTYDHSPSVH